MFLKNIFLSLLIVTASSLQSFATDGNLLEKEFDSLAYTTHYSSEGDPFHDWLRQPSGVTLEGELRRKDVVVSMTTHPPRIGTTYLALESLLRQTRKPNKIIVYLAKDDFQDRSLPLTLVQLQDRGVEVRFSEINYRVATKLIPAMKDFPEATIITVDDDRIYSNNLLEVLLAQHEKYPQAIICPHVRKYVWDDSNSDFPHIDYLKQDVVYGEDSDNSLYGIFEGFAGVLYPAYSLHPEVFNFDNFKRLTPCADDIWFQTMAFLQGTRVMSLDKKTAQSIYWPKEIAGTQESGLYHEHLNANGTMAYKAFYYYGLLDQLNLPTLAHMDCQACKRKISLIKQGTEFPALSMKKANRCKGCLNDNQKKVLFIGAYDYGNIGDKMYKEIFNHYFSKDFAVTFIPDTVRVNLNGEYIHFESSEEDLDFDALVIGGGGIIKEFKETSSIGYYATQAMHQNKPYFFVSVGIQTTHPTLSTSQAKETIGTSLELLKNASVIVPRSLDDYHLFKSILGEDYKGSINFAPDLGYLYPQLYPTLQMPEKKYITLIQTGSANVRMTDVREIIGKKLMEFPSSQLVVLNMGGLEKPGAREDFSEYTLFAIETKKHFPQAIVYMGDTLSDELIKLKYSTKKIRKPDVNPQQALEIIGQSYYVITGRYHGLILSKALGIPCKTAIYSYKTNAERKGGTINPEKTLSSLNGLKYFIENGSAAIPSPVTWDNDDRNHFIVSVNGQYPEMSIPYIQAMDNESLYNLVAFGFIDDEYNT